jgi:hypothetical protein
MNRRQLGLAAATAAFALLAAGAPQLAASAGKEASVKCAGINECKGHGECQTATNDCKGHNSCKSEGWVTKPSAENCRAAGGKVIS